VSGVLRALCLGFLVAAGMACGDGFHATNPDSGGKRVYDADLPIPVDQDAQINGDNDSAVPDGSSSSDDAGGTGGPGGLDGSSATDGSSDAGGTDGSSDAGGTGGSSDAGGTGDTGGTGRRSIAPAISRATIMNSRRYQLVGAFRPGVASVTVSVSPRFRLHSDLVSASQ